MIETEYYGTYSIELWEYLMLPVLLIIIYIVSAWIRNKHILKEPHYKYYMPGVFAKVFGGITLCLIYIYYYRGGDTIMYFESAWAMDNLFWERPADFFSVLFGKNDQAHLLLFSNTTGFPYAYMYYDARTFLVIRLVAPFMIIGAKSYLLSTILVAWATFSGVWKLFTLFCNYYKELVKQFAISILFFPSVLFWGSGILKDTFTLSATCWFVYCIYMIFLKKRSRIKYTIIVVFCSIIIIAIKPYILMTLLPGATAWMLFERITKIRNEILRYTAIPMIFSLCLVGGFFVLNLLGSVFDQFSIDKVFVTAAITQQDLKQDYYQGSAFDIGDFEPTAQGALAIAPAAIVAGIYRPFLWDANNIVMLISALENTFVLGLSIYLLVRIRLRRLLKIFFNNPLLLFSISYAVLFAFSVGLSTSNFGALVRFKIPYLSFFISGLFILLYFNRKENVMLTKVREPDPRRAVPARGNKK
jgi:hypothetical protein